MTSKHLEAEFADDAAASSWRASSAAAEASIRSHWTTGSVRKKHPDGRRTLLMARSESRQASTVAKGADLARAGRCLAKLSDRVPTCALEQGILFKNGLERRTAKTSFSDLPPNKSCYQGFTALSPLQGIINLLFKDENYLRHFSCSRLGLARF